MDIVLLSGGLGNQLSQYAFAIAKRRKSPRVKVNSYLTRRQGEHNGYELQRVFGIPDESDIWSDLICRYFRKIVFLSINRFWGPFCKCMLALTKCIMRCGNMRLVLEEGFDASLLEHKQGLNIYWGGWHSEKYYSLVEDEIRSAYKFDTGKLNGKSLALKKRLDNLNGVSLHIRRGDKMSEENMKIYGDICTEEYYRKAVDYIKARVDNPTFVVFSDDSEWTRDNVRLENCIYVDWNKGEDSWQDLCLMSFCKHNIGANSTFSWWGAWLNGNPDKIVVVPSVFFQGVCTPDIWPEKWIKI